MKETELFEQLETVRLNDISRQDEILKEYDQYMEENYSDLEENMQYMFLEDTYVEWLRVFLEKHQMFDTSNWVEIEETLENDVPNIYLINTFVEQALEYLNSEKEESYNTCILVYENQMYALERNSYFDGQVVEHGAYIVDESVQVESLQPCMVSYEAFKNHCLENVNDRKIGR